MIALCLKNMWTSHLILSHSAWLGFVPLCTSSAACLCNMLAVGCWLHAHRPCSRWGDAAVCPALSRYQLSVCLLSTLTWEKPEQRVAPTPGWRVMPVAALGNTLG